MSALICQLCGEAVTECDRPIVDLAEARDVLFAELEAAVEAMHLPFGNDLRLDRVRDETLAAVLDLIRKAGEK
jgi:hypothetical protein